NAMASAALRMVASSKGEAIAAGTSIDVVLNKLKADPELNQAILECGIPINIGFAGSAGKSFDAVINSLTKGSLTEKAVHLINFGDEFVKKQLIAKTTSVLNQVKANLEKLGSPVDIDAKI